MYLHANAKLGLAGRLALVRAIEGGLSLRAAAAVFAVSPATAHRWWHRWLEGGCEPGALLDRSSRPHRSPRLLAAELQRRICDCRRETGWGPRLVAGATGLAHSTVWKVLRRAGISRSPRAVSEEANSYEWPCPGDLLHMDVSRYARFLRPGHRVTGDAHNARATVSVRRRASATTLRTRSSTTTPDSPTSSSTKTRRQQPSRASSSERSPSLPSTGSSRSD
jgi:transposase